MNCIAPAQAVKNHMTLQRWTSALFAVLLVAWLLPSLLAQQTLSDEEGQPAETERAEPAVPDLNRLIARPHNELALVARHYAADRASLNRFYTLPGSPARQARMTRFRAEWLAALDRLDPHALSGQARGQYTRLRQAIGREQLQADTAARELDEIARLLPFAPTVIQLEESRRRLEPVDAARAAGLLNELPKQIGRARAEFQDAPERWGQAHAARAAAAVAELHKALNAWFGYYHGYDPLFTWWMAEPYKGADQALDDYAQWLKKNARDDSAAEQQSEKAGQQAPDPADAGRKQPAAEPPTAPTADVPDLSQLIAFPHSELQIVIERFEAQRRAMQDRRTARSGQDDAKRSGEQRMRLERFCGQWLAALQALDFDRLSRDAQIDYLLLRNSIQQQLGRLGLQDSAARETAVQADSDITGRPLGRQALLLELAAEMIPYTPEELIAIAEQEFAWCEQQMKQASRELGCGDHWQQALEKVKGMHVEPGRQPELIRDLAHEAIDYVEKHDLVTVPPLARDTWRMEMMSPQRQLINPFFTGGEVIRVSFPTHTMSHEAKLQSMRGNNIPFARATVHHELIPGHHLQGFVADRYRSYRAAFSTPFWTEGWALYWEMLLYQQGFVQSPEDRMGMLFWRMHRCARIVFSLNFHLGNLSPRECIHYLVERVGHERDNATAEVRRSFAGDYSPLYQAAYMLGGLQIRQLRRELVQSGKMTERQFHDRVLRENRIPIELVRASLTGQPLTPDFQSQWKFYRPD